MTTPGKYHHVTLISLGAWPPLPPNFDYCFLSSSISSFSFLFSPLSLYCLWRFALPDTITSSRCLNLNASALGRDYSHPSSWYISFNVWCPKRRPFLDPGNWNQHVHMLLYPDRMWTSVEVRPQCGCLAGIQQVSRALSCVSRHWWKGKLCTFLLSLSFFFSLSSTFFLRTDFLRELLMLRAFYPDISDNDVTTQVHLLLFLWKLTEA